MTKPLPISITVSDPWDVGEAVNWRTIRGVLLQTADADHGGKVLMRFDHDINYRGSAYRYAVGSPRLEGRHVAETEAGKSVGCVLIGIFEEQAKSSNPMDTSKWRGGLAFVGDLTPIKNSGG
jgi:hypothetical protein